MHQVAVNQDTNTLLFDHDGTLVNSERVHYELWQKVANFYGVTIDEEFYSDVMAGVPTKQNALDVVSHFNLSVSPSVLEKQKLDSVINYLQQQAFPLMPYAKEAIIAAFNAGFTLGIVTAGSKTSVYKTLETYQLTPYISCIVAVEDVQNSKPAPDCYLKAAQHLGKTPQQCVAIEDTQHGMQAAISAGIPCVAIPTPHSQNHDFSLASSRYASLQEWLQAEIIKA
ncbi:HAD family phosphatase [Paraglaciecola sp. L3A3]|uniref:HAD family hydrolase n=1 Tax=Paraglaciecola sp. L3A3 TaxID=2686358 RepID=UPI00131E8855|nr:HAD family phosphatase [Paraglaciecola sp. L3A3]